MGIRTKTGFKMTRYYEMYQNKEDSLKIIWVYLHLIKILKMLISFRATLWNFKDHNDWKNIGCVAKV